MAFIELHCLHAFFGSLQWLQSVATCGQPDGLHNWPRNRGERPTGAPTDEEIERMIEERHLFAKRSVKDLS